MTTIRRIYAYLLAFAGLGMLAVAAANLGQLAIDLLVQAPSAFAAERVRDTLAGALYGASQLLYYAVARLLGVESPGGVGGNLLQAAAGPASTAIVYAVAWAYQRYALQRQAAAVDEAPRQAGVRRLYTYVVALISLATLAVGAAGLLWTAGDLLVNTTATTSGEGWRSNIALFATLAAVGLPVWLLHWQPTPGSEADVRSLSRRLYVYLALIGAMLSLVGSAAAGLYRVISLLLGASSSASVLTDLTRAVAVAIVAAAVAAYHGVSCAPTRGSSQRR